MRVAVACSHHRTTTTHLASRDAVKSPHRAAVAALAIAVLAASVIGCGGGDAAPAQTGHANPVPGPALAPSDFANLPKPGSARPADAPSESDTSITQSYTVAGLGPLEVLGYYATTLPPDGWVPVRVERLAYTTVRSHWRRGNERLLVTAFSEQGVTSAGPTQLDLLLQT
jgi:hypothetical protein